MKNIYCIGELLIDFISKEKRSLKDSLNFEKKAGGAPANVACAISKLTGKSYFLGQVGDDQFGKFLKEILLAENVDTFMMVEEGQTTLAFVALDEQGERSFQFFKGSDQEYLLDERKIGQIPPKNIIHFGSATAFLGGNLDKSYDLLLNHALNNEHFISFDPNFRDALIDSKEKFDYFKKRCIKYIGASHLVKMSEEELLLLTNIKNQNEALDYLHNLGAKIICVTLGAKGTLLSIPNNRKIIPSIKIKQVDSTGAGDAFIGAVLYKISIIPESEELDFEKIQRIVEFANKVGALTCTNYGAISSLPNLERVENFS